MDTVQRSLRVGTAAVGEDLDIDQEGAHAAPGVDPFGAARAQCGGSDVRAVALTVIGVNRAVGVGSRGGGIKACDPFLVVVARGVAVRFVVHVIEIIERTVLVVNPGVQDGNDHAFTGVATGIGAGGVDIGRHGPGGFRSHTVEGHHDVLHLDDHHAGQPVEVHQRTHGHLVHHDGVNGVHHLEPCTFVFTHPTVIFEGRLEGCNLGVVGRPGVIHNNGDGFQAVRPDDRSRRDGFLAGEHALQPVVHAVPI